VPTTTSKSPTSTNHEGSTIHGLVHGQARAAPEALALAGVGRDPLTYGGLHAQVASCGATLNALGVGRNDRVAIVLPGGPEMAAAFLGVASVATSAPLNPAYGVEELDFYLADLDAKAVIVQEDFESPVRQVARERGIPLVELRPLPDSGAGAFSLSCAERAHGAAPSGPARPEDVALVLHTSGTTSRPKIVPLTHANLCSSAGNIRSTLRLTAADRCLNIMPLFHIHGLVGALLSSLAAGAGVVCTGFQAPEFFDWIRRFRPTWYSGVPTMHQAILARVPENREIVTGCPLRLIRSSSASLPPQVMARLEEAFQAPVIESYGMTEASHQMASNPLPPGQRKPGSVGMAAGPEVAIMDDSGNLLGPNEIGEVVIRGPNVNHGYENNPAANESAFTDGWFRTGDQGYLDQDRYLTLTGRLKEIINRGGEKISPREVDEVLLDHPAVAQAVAFALPDPQLGEDVAAVVVLKAPAQEREIREFVAQRLAHFKVPRQIVIADDIPKGPTGKLRRIGLADQLGLVPDDDEAPRPESAGSGAPATEREKALGEIWRQVLKLDAVRVGDDFFDLGGDSLLAGRVITKVREELACELSYLDFHDSPTLAAMAEVLRELPGSSGSPPPAGPRTPAPGGTYPLSSGQMAVWLQQQFDPSECLYNRPSVLHLEGPIDIPVLERTFDEIVRRHDVLRTIVTETDGLPEQSVRPAAPQVLHVVDLSDVPASRRSDLTTKLLAEEVRRPFDLARGPLLRTVAVAVDPHECLLLINAHHMVFDGGSEPVLFREMSELYPRISRGLPRLPELECQYVDFVWSEQELLQGDRLSQAVSYWTRQLAGVAPLELPVDRPRPRGRRFRGATLPLALPVELVRELRAFSREGGCTPFMTLLTALQLLVHRLSGQEDFVIGVPVANRGGAGFDRLIGLFVSTLPLRVDVSGNPSLRELTARARKACLECFAHQMVSTERLVGELRPEQGENAPPLVQVAFTFQRDPLDSLKLPGHTVRAVAVDPGTSRTDLHVTLREDGDHLNGFCEYDTDLFDSRTIAWIIEDFRYLLDVLATEPDTRIDRLAALRRPLPDGAAPEDQKLRAAATESNLTKRQLLVWMGQKLQPELPLYNVVIASTIHARIDPDHFNQAFQALVNSSDALRTVVREEAGMPRQCVEPELRTTPRLVDLSDAHDPDHALGEWIRQRNEQRFDFERPMFDSVLIRCADEKFLWYLKYHHIIADGWSGWLMFHHMSELYAQSVLGELPEKVDLPAFENYIRHERRYRTSSRARTTEDYWKKRLAERSDPIVFYGRRPHERSHRIRRVPCDLGPERARRIRTAAARLGMHDIFAAALGSYLHRVSGNSRVCIGIHIHNRRSGKFRQTIGIFMETLPLQVTIEENDTFSSLIDRIRVATREIYRHGRYTLGNPLDDQLYDVALNLQPMGVQDFAGHPVDIEWIHPGYDHLSLSLQLHDFVSSGDFVLDFDLDRDVFDEHHRQLAIAHFLQFLDALLDDAGTRIRDVPMFSSDAQRERSKSLADEVQIDFGG